jgi:hypothetical protein
MPRLAACIQSRPTAGRRPWQASSSPSATPKHPAGPAGILCPIFAYNPTLPPSKPLAIWRRNTTTARTPARCTPGGVSLPPALQRPQTRSRQRPCTNPRPSPESSPSPSSSSAPSPFLRPKSTPPAIPSLRCATAPQVGWAVPTTNVNHRRSKSRSSRHIVGGHSPPYSMPSSIAVSSRSSKFNGRFSPQPQSAS